MRISDWSSDVCSSDLFSVMRKMFNLAEVWGYRPDGTNPCRHVPMFPAGKATHLISDEEMGKLFHYLDHLEAEGLEHPVIPLAIRLQFEFAARRSEIAIGRASCRERVCQYV